MAVAYLDQHPWMAAYSTSLDEVLEGLTNKGIQASTVLAIEYDGTDWFAIWRSGP